MKTALLATAALVACADVVDQDEAALASVAFTNVTRLATYPDYAVERVTYHVGTLAVVGQVCRPTRAGRFPILIFNHGGFDGLGDEWNGDLCAAAATGLVVAMASYRGEDGSSGRVEVCAGEVDDVLGLLSIVRVQPYADAGRAVMIGSSHGGCITLRALARGAPVRAAVDLFGPVHWAAEYGDLEGKLANGTAGDLAPLYRDVLAHLEAATGGTPTQRPAAYSARSPFFEIGRLANAAPDLLIVHGAADRVVSVDQSCAVVGGLAAISSHVTLSGTVTTTPPPTCTDLVWSSSPLPHPSWPGHRRFVVYDGAGHGGTTPADSRMINDALEFVLARLGLSG